MREISFKQHRFPPDVIRYVAWLYCRVTMSLRNVEDLRAERGIDVSYETVRCWANKFGPAIAANIREARGRGDSVWHLDEMVVRISGKRMFMWRAVDDESARCSASNPKARPSASFPPTPQSTTASPSSVTLSRAKPCAAFERQHLPNGALRPGQMTETVWVGLSSCGEF